MAPWTRSSVVAPWCDRSASSETSAAGFFRLPRPLISGTADSGTMKSNAACGFRLAWASIRSAVNEVPASPKSCSARSSTGIR